jgi:hypothetical protein
MHSNNLPALIGLTGRAGAGKDTLADHLVSSFGYVKYSLASPLKNGLNATFGFTPEQWTDRAWKEEVIPWIGRSPRQLAQTLGTDWGRELVAGDIWLRCAGNFIDTLPKGCPGVVIADVRFNNEALFIKHRGGVVCQITRPDVEAVSAHISEAGVALHLLDATLTNNGSMETLADLGELILRNLSAPFTHDHHFD